MDTAGLPDISISGPWRRPSTEWRAAGRWSLWGVAAAGAVTLSVFAVATSAVWASGVTVAGLSILSVVDVRSRRLPTSAVHAMAALTAVGLLGQALLAGSGGQLARSVIAAVAAGTGLGAVWLVAPRHLGLGDVRLLATVLPVTAFASWVTVAWTVEVTCLAGLVSVPLVRLGRRDASDALSIPLAPALLAGFIVAVLVS